MAFWWGEVEAEIRQTDADYSFRNNSELEKFMQFTEERRRREHYKHDRCAPECKARGSKRTFCH